MTNHPPKGSRLTVDPIRCEKAIQTIKQLLSHSPRDLLLFTLGINNGLRVGDLLQLRWKHLKDLKENNQFILVERKTGKQNCLLINKAVYPALKKYKEEMSPKDDDYVFKSRKGDNRPITVSTVNNLVKEWCKKVNLGGNYGAHTLRKTFGYMQRTKYGADIELLAKRFNHSSPRITMRYVGIVDSEVDMLLRNTI